MDTRQPPCKCPICLGTLITKKAELYKAGRGLQRGGAAALLLRLEGGAERVRHYFEFFLSPEGTFDLPPMLLAPHVTDHHIVFTQSMSSHVILAIRHLQCGQEFSDTAPDVDSLRTHRGGSVLGTHRCLISLLQAVSTSEGRGSSRVQGARCQRFLRCLVGLGGTEAISESTRGGR